jgi:hypothetical protein
MNEKFTDNFEKEPESIPDIKEVLAIIEPLLKGAEHETVRQLEDEQGLYLLEIKIPGEDGDTEYSYMRKGRYPEGKAMTTTIHVTFFDGTGFPVGGHSIAKHREGEWKLTP